MSEKISKNQRNNYPSPFCLRFTDDERKTLELSAGDRPLGTYIRWLIFGNEIPKNRTRGKKPVKDQKELAKLLALFGQSRIASNINQLAKAANSGSLPVNEDALKALNEANSSVHWIRNTLMKALGLQGKDDDPKSR